jgi:hypothetical protein
MALRSLLHGVMVALVASLTLGPPARAAAATTEPKDSEETMESKEDFSLTHRKELYRQGRLSHGKAILYNTVPGLGNFYANQYVLGGVALSLMGFVAVLVPFGLVTDQPTFTWFGAGLAGFAYAGSVTTSIVGVSTYNRRLRESLRLDEHGDHSAFLRDLPQSRQITLVDLRF